MGMLLVDGTAEGIELPWAVGGNKKHWLDGLGDAFPDLIYKQRRFLKISIVPEVSNPNLVNSAIKSSFFKR